MGGNKIKIMEKHKTKHENKSDIEQFWIHDYTAVDLFPKVETRTSIIAKFKNKILQLDKYQPTYEGLMDKSEEYGEYVRIEDVLNIF